MDFFRNDKDKAGTGEYKTAVIADIGLYFEQALEGLYEKYKGAELDKMVDKLREDFLKAFRRYVDELKVSYRETEHYRRNRKTIDILGIDSFIIASAVFGGDRLYLPSINPILGSCIEEAIRKYHMTEKEYTSYTGKSRRTYYRTMDKIRAGMKSSKRMN